MVMILMEYGIHDCEIFANLRLKLYNQTSFNSRASSDITNCIRTKWLEGVVEAEVEAAVDEDAGAGDPEAAVEAAEAVTAHRLDVAVHDAGELALARGVPGVHAQPRAGVVYALHEQERQRARAAAGQDVLGKLLFVRSIFGGFECFLDLILTKFKH